MTLMTAGEHTGCSPAVIDTDIGPIEVPRDDDVHLILVRFLAILADLNPPGRPFVMKLIDPSGSPIMFGSSCALETRYERSVVCF